MKFLALTLLPLALAAAVSNPLETRDIAVKLDANEALNVLGDLIKSGEIEISGPADEHDTNGLSKRTDVPFLHCGFARALRCVGTTAGTLNACFWAAISRGKDIKDDAGCAAAATALGSNLATDCKLCLGIA